MEAALRLEKVDSPLAQGWEHVRRLTARQYSDWLKASKDSDNVSSAIQFVALVVCDKDGKSRWATTDQAIEEVGNWDWQIVHQIDKQGCAFNGFNETVESAEKN